MSKLDSDEYKRVRPNRKTIETVVEHLKELDLSVYGPNMDADTGVEFPSLMDYSVDEIIKRRKHIENNTIVEVDLNDY